MNKIDVSTGKITDWRWALKTTYGEKIGEAVLTLIDAGFTPEMYEHAEELIKRRDKV
jgi:hypothetical protein